MRDIDPTAATNLEELAARLRQLHRVAGMPAYRKLEEQTLHASGVLPGTNLERVPIRRSTLSDTLAGRKLPRKAFLLSFVEACGVKLDTDHRWEEAWDRIAAQSQDPSNPAGVEKIDHEVKDLRRKLTAAELSDHGSAENISRSQVLGERATVTLIPAVERDLRRLQERTNLSRTDIANRAIALYEFFDAQLSAGRDLIIRDSETGEAQIVRFL